MQDPNILPFLSATLEPNEFTLVSEWMTNGNINNFIQKHTEVNLVQLVCYRTSLTDRQLTGFLFFCAESIRARDRFKRKLTSFHSW